MKQVKYQIEDSQQNIIYPIFKDQEICSHVCERLGYDLNQIVNKELGQVTKIHTLGYYSFDSIYFIGLGVSQYINTFKLRKAFSKISREVEECISFDAMHAVTETIDIHQITRLFVESYMLSKYQEAKIGHDSKEIMDIDIMSMDDNIEDDIHEGIAYGTGINYARQLADKPANYMNPCDLVKEAKTLASQYGMECTILDKDTLEEMKAGGILSVNQGSHIPAYLICLKYSKTDEPYTAIVGKGITFDSGGYNLKGNSYGMKYDMCGAADVLGIMKILAETNANVNVYGIIPTTENLVSDRAYKPQDVITTLSGKTVEIVSTDAEGRLILCDALTYAQQLGVKRIIDLATLTGACVSALGDVYTGVFANNDAFYYQFSKAMNDSDEKGWRLPMDEEYFAKLKSSSADFKNSVGKPGAGASVAANFLEAFIEKDVEWIHLDIAGTADNNGTGATGTMIRSIVNMLKGD